MSAVEDFLGVDPKLAATLPANAIILPSGSVKVMDTAAALAKLIAPRKKLFVRADLVVELVRDSSGLRLEPIREYHAVTRFEDDCTLLAWRAGKDGKFALKPMKLPVNDAKAILLSRELLDGLPHIEVVSNSPLLLPDGTVLGKGYHSDCGGVLVVGSCKPEEVDPADAAVALLELLQDFQFASDGDHSRALASLLNPAIKMASLIRGPMPIDVVEADYSQAGKTYLQKLIREIYGEDAYPIVRRTGGVGSMDESIAAAIYSGKRFITLENVRGMVDSQLLEMILTWGKSVPVRLPYHGEVQVDPSRVSFQMTSNGVQTTQDLANRFCIVRIKKQKPEYNFPRFPEGDLLAHAIARQPYFLGCVFSIVRAWIQADKPVTNERRHDFQEWVSALDWIVQNLLFSAHLMEGHRPAQERASDPLLTWLRRLAVEIASDPVDAMREFRASDLVVVCRSKGIDIPGVSSEDRAAQMIGTHMGNLFRDAVGEEIVTENIKVSRFTRKDALESYREIHFYHFGAL